MHPAFHSQRQHLTPRVLPSQKLPCFPEKVPCFLKYVPCFFENVPPFLENVPCFFQMKQQRSKKRWCKYARARLEAKTELENVKLIIHSTHTHAYARIYQEFYVFYCHICHTFPKPLYFNTLQKQTSVLNKKKVHKPSFSHSVTAI